MAAYPEAWLAPLSGSLYPLYPRLHVVCGGRGVLSQPILPVVIPVGRSHNTVIVLLGWLLGIAAIFTRAWPSSMLSASVRERGELEVQAARSLPWLAFRHQAGALSIRANHAVRYLVSDSAWCWEVRQIAGPGSDLIEPFVRAIASRGVSTTCST